MSKFQVVSEYQPAGDQPEAIAALAAGIENGLDEQTLLGVTGSGKTFTMAKVIEAVQRPTLVLAHNKTLAAQLCAEFKEFFPNNAVEYFVSYYDYYQPEAYIPHTDTFIEKDSAVNEEIDRLRLAATASLMERRDVIVVSSVSCIYGLGEPEDFAKMMVSLRVGTQMEREELLKKLKLDIKSHAKLGSLSIAQMQMVEIAKAVSANCKVLILDEPTSSLTANEVESLFRIMRELKEQGVALVYISHKMDEIKVIADEVTIMRDGHYIGKWDVANMTKEQIIAKMVGRELSNLFPPLENHPSDEVMMKVEDFTSIHPRSFRHCSFELKKGEILGVAGLVGAQRTELMEGIFGLRAHTAGKVWIKGEEVEIKQPRDAIRKSVALLTEDRRATGIMGVLSVADNISIASLDALRKGPIMLDDKKILNLVATNKEKMAIKVPSPKTAIKSLSGGNQQKVLIARWLANNPDVLILDEPTRGIDVGAKYEIYCIIAELAKQGKSIIMISSEMSEIIGMSNRVMVMCDGRITGFIDGKDATQENIMALATQFETAPTTAAANQ